MTQEPQTGSAATRRGVLAGVGLVGLASAISACGASSASSATADGGPTSTAAGAALATASSIPVGSGTIFTAEKVVVTQPTAGKFKAFSAVCTHMGCLVNQINDGTIDCPCHGSQYSITTGAVVAGPAPAPLPARQIKISGGSIFLE